MGNPEKRYDLEDRTLAFAKDIRLFIKSLDHTLGNYEDARQVIRSSGSIGANYIEANEALSKKDFCHRIKISKKESKETIFWLKLLEVKESNEKERTRLIQEATELMKILGAILEKST